MNDRALLDHMKTKYQSKLARLKAECLEDLAAIREIEEQTPPPLNIEQTIRDALRPSAKEKKTSFDIRVPNPTQEIK